MRPRAAADTKKPAHKFTKKLTGEIGIAQSLALKMPEDTGSSV